MFERMKDMASLLKNAREMQSRMEEVQSRLRRATVSAQSDDGAVRVHANGVGEILSIEVAEAARIDDRLDELKNVVNQALKLSKDLHMREMAQVAAGMDLPGMDDMKKFLG